MNIVYISQHFPPEIGAAQGRAFDMAYFLAEEGNQVTMLTTFPNDRGTPQLFKKETIQGINVRRSFRIKDTKKSSMRRLANYFSFMASSILSGVFIKRQDIIYATSPQLFVGVSGYVLSKIHRAKFVFEVRDLWVDFAEVLSQFNNKRLLNLARKLEMFLYKKADMIVTVTYGYKERLITLGIPADKIKVVTNGVNPILLHQEQTTNIDIKEKYELTNKFIILFAGNIGAAQGLDVLLDAALKIKNNKDIQFVLIGDGVEKERLKREADNLQLDNILILNSMPRSQLLDYYRAADVCLISLKKHPLFEITIPSKVFDCMGMNKPVLIGVDGEARTIIEDSNAGLYFKPEDSEDLVEKINILFHNPTLLANMKRDMKETVLKRYNRRELAKGLSKTFNDL